MASAARAIAAADRVVVPSSSIETASWASPAREGGCRLPPPGSATVKATVGKSRWGSTQTAIPLLSLRICGEGAR